MVGADEDRAPTRERSARSRKSAEAFRTISEVSKSLDVPQHVLRFWETKFSQIRPLKRGGGRRYYRPEDVVLLRGVRDLLHIDGYTIRGVQKLLREGGVRVLQDRAQGAAPRTEPPSELVRGSDRQGAGSRRDELAAILDELEKLRRMLETTD